MNFQFYAIIYVFPLLNVFPVMKFSELSIIYKDKNSQNLNISIWYITIKYIPLNYSSIS